MKHLQSEVIFTRTAAAMVEYKLSTPSILSAIHKIKALLSRDEKFKCLGIGGFSLIISLLEIFTATVIVILAQVLNEPEVGHKYLTRLGMSPHLSAEKTVLYISLIVGGIYLLKNVIATIELFYLHFTIQKLNFDFKNKLLHRYSKIDYGFYQTRNSALGMSVVGGDVEQMFSSGMVAVASIFSESAVFFSLVIMVVWMDPSLALVVAALGGILGILVIKGLLPKFYYWGTALQEAALHSGQNLQQFFYAFKEIVLLGKRDAFVNAYKFHSYKKSRVQAMQMATNGLPRVVIETLFVVLFVMSIVFLCFEHENPIQRIGILSVYLYAGFRLMPALNRIINQLNNFKLTIPSIERVYNEYNTVVAKENYVNVPKLKFEKSIVIQDLTFSYLNTQKDVLSNINLEIKKGECIGIVGETGSGKSTLIDLILGLLRPCKGSISIDSEYPTNSYQWHQLIGYVPQSIYLIDHTIEANITFCEKPEDINQEKLNKVIEAAQLHNFIDQLPAGTKTVVGECGIRLSGGERQRISIARALYHDPEVLIFDEATSSLDNQTEALLMDTIRAVSQNRTVIMIAHRLSTLKDCDRIIVLENGCIKEIVDYNQIQKKRVKSHG
jgi:ATP-binding cassette subfamily C protein